MANSVELFGAGWGALTGLSIGFLALQAWRARQRGTAVPSGSARPTGPMAPHHDASLKTFEAEELDVAHEVARSVNELRAVVQRQQVEVEVAVQPRLVVWADPCALRQMLVGILVPAVERAVGGAVLVSAGWHGGRVQLTVMDDGRAGDRAVLISQLRQVEQCVALQGGTLEIECRPPRGNHVVLRLPGIAEPETPAIDDDMVDEPVIRDALWTRVDGAS